MGDGVLVAGGELAGGLDELGGGLDELGGGVVPGTTLRVIVEPGSTTVLAAGVLCHTVPGVAPGGPGWPLLTV